MWTVDDSAPTNRSPAAPTQDIWELNRFRRTPDARHVRPTFHRPSCKPSRFVARCEFALVLRKISTGWQAVNQSTIININAGDFLSHLEGFIVRSGGHQFGHLWEIIFFLKFWFSCLTIFWSLTWSRSFWNVYGPEILVQPSMVIFWLINKNKKNQDSDITAKITVYTHSANIRSKVRN